MKVHVKIEENTFKKAFTLIGLGVGFILWYYFDSIFLMIGSPFIGMGVGVLIDKLYYQKRRKSEL